MQILIILAYFVQISQLLDTLQVLPGVMGHGHIALFRSLLIGNLNFSGVQRIQSWPFVGKKLGDSNRQDLVFIRPPGIQEGGFELRLDNVWFCRVLLLFKIKAQTDSGIKEFECAYVSVLEQYTGRHVPGMHIMHIMITLAYSDYFAYYDNFIINRMDRGYKLGDDL